MARLAVLFTVIFLILTVSNARLIVQKQTVIPEETVTDLPESDPTITNSIVLPSDKPDSEPAEIVNSEHDDASEADSDLDSVPLTMISFRPVNGHFPRHPLIPFRHKHNCHSHKRLRNSRFQRKRYISYGNDMILSDERTPSDPESGRLGLQIQSRWDRFSDNGTESNEHVDFRKPHNYNHEHEDEQDHDDDHHHHHHHHHHRRGEEDERHESEEQDGGFMERFRKFLINF